MEKLDYYSGIKIQNQGRQLLPYPDSFLAMSFGFSDRTWESEQYRIATNTIKHSIKNAGIAFAAVQKNPLIPV